VAHRGRAERAYVQVVPDGIARGDASVLASAIEAQHPDPFRAVSRDALLREAARVDALGTDNRSVLTVELMRTLALLGPRNGHSSIHPLGNHPTAPYAYPLRLFEFDDGVFVVAAERREFVGTELVAVDGADVVDVLRAVTPLIAHDNEWNIRARRPTFTVQASVLRGLGLVDDDRQATFRLRFPSGSVSELTLEAIAVADYPARLGADPLPERPGPAYLRRRLAWHWAEPAADGRAVHVGYNVTRGDVEEFAHQVEALASTSRVELIVLDLRHNSGGDNRTYRPLLTSLERLATEKRLAVLTSRATFSAAMQFVVDLERNTPAVFVGEPTGGSPNQYGDATAVELPNIGLNAYVATIAWMTAGESDERLTREPDIRVVHDSTTFFAGDDPTLDAAVAAVC
jgi:hypothetical protein